MLKLTQVATALLCITPPLLHASSTDGTTWEGSTSEFNARFETEDGKELLSNYEDFSVNVEGDQPWTIPSVSDWWDNKNLTINAQALMAVSHKSILSGHLNSFKLVNKNKGHGLWMDLDFPDQTSDTLTLEISASETLIQAGQHALFVGTLPYSHNIKIRDFKSLTMNGGTSGSGGSGVVVNGRGSIELIGTEDSSIVISTEGRYYDHDAAIANKTSYDELSANNDADPTSSIRLFAGAITLNQDCKNTGYIGIYSGEKSAKIADGSFIDSQVTLESQSNAVYGAYFGIIQNGKGTVELLANNGNNLVKLTTTESLPYDPDDPDTIKSDALEASAIRVQGAQDKKGTVRLSGIRNEINGAEGSGMAIYSSGLSEVNLTAQDQNIVKGLIIAGSLSVPVEANTLTLRNDDSDSEAIINFVGNAELASSFLAEHNYTNEQNESCSYQYVISAIAMDQGNIQFEQGSRVDIRTEFDQTEGEIRERAAWAYGGKLNFQGTELHVSTQQGVRFDNSVGIALAASDNGTVNATGLLTGSRIVGDLVGGVNGIVNLSLAQGNGTYVRRDVEKTDADLTGNVLAGNGGTVNIELGQGAVWLGRADDYRDADETGETWSGKHTEIFAPQFSDTITSSGSVNISLSEGAIWGITGQSWVTTLSGTGGIIDLAGGHETNSHALRVWNIQGSHTFVLDLNDLAHAESDMLYLKRQTSTYAAQDNDLVQNIVIENIQGLEQMAAGDKIRFATVDGGITFRTATVEGEADVIQILDKGMINSGFVIGNEDYQVGDDENYNGASNAPDAGKPGQNWVDDKFAEGQNWFLVRDPSKDTVSSTAINVFDMGKANYRTAVYMDTLNKRQGEARFGAGENQGLWARVRRDQINQKGAFESSNIMAEIGFDTRSTTDSGVRRTGIAVDYMDGTIDYTGTGSDGDMKRWGLWLYDTWMGDDGQYTDIVFKWGRLSNDFSLRAQSSGETITGGYDNDVFSISGEYGVKFSSENGSYIEPQVQLQYSRVTSASYSTSQSSRIDMDAINSWIGRIGTRMGRQWTNKDSRMDIYVKADLLREFDGEQTIHAVDSTGSGTWVYANEGNWGDLGLGFTYRGDKERYAFFELEKMLGNDYGSSWQVSAGMRLNF